MTKIPYSKLILIQLLSLMLASCSGANDDLVKYINQVKTRPVKKIQPIPEFAPLPSFKFPESINRRNPFKPIELTSGNEVDAPDQNRPKQLLEAFPLDSLKFVGILKQGNEIWGLIELPDKKVTRVKVGDYMGQNYGRVVVIKDKSIQLEESIKDIGKWEKQSTTIDLYTGK